MDPTRPTAIRTLLITGGMGQIGRKLRREMSARFEHVRILDRVAGNDLAPNEAMIMGDIADMATVDAAMAGVDGVIHMAGINHDTDFETILHGNVVGTWNIYDSARRHGVGRVVYGSSNHAVGFYPRSQRIDATVLPRPDSCYGLSKCWGEAVGALHADKHGIRSLHLRIGNAADTPGNARSLRLWISARDLAQLCMIGLEHPDIHNTIVYGVSANAGSWYDNSEAERLGYAPQDSADDYTQSAMAAEAGIVRDPVALHFQGGDFCAQGYTGPALPAHGPGN